MEASSARLPSLEPSNCEPGSWNARINLVQRLHATGPGPGKQQKALLRIPSKGRVHQAVSQRFAFARTHLGAGRQTKGCQNRQGGENALDERHGLLSRGGEPMADALIVERL